MYECAKKVIARNGCSDKITLVNKHSTEVVVGVDIPEKCNILVTEVFDTELIGEGAIRTYNHARENIMLVRKFFYVAMATD
jgi:protein arginine N-methyltransferase 7